MSVKNSYPELPEIEYKKTSVPMADVLMFAKSLHGKYQADTIRMAYAIFRNESANGKKGVNNNYSGIQADVGRWIYLPGNPVATCTRIDSGNQLRRFLCFNEDGYKIGFELLCIKIEARGMKTVNDYFSKWVGNKNPSEEHKKNFQALLDNSSDLL